MSESAGPSKAAMITMHVHDGQTHARTQARTRRCTKCTWVRAERVMSVIGKSKASISRNVDSLRTIQWWSVTPTAAACLLVLSNAAIVGRRTLSERRVSPSAHIARSESCRSPRRLLLRGSAYRSTCSRGTGADERSVH